MSEQTNAYVTPVLQVAEARRIVREELRCHCTTSGSALLGTKVIPCTKHRLLTALSAPGVSDAK